MWVSGHKVEKMCPFTVFSFNLKVTLNKNNKFRIFDTSYQSRKKKEMEVGECMWVSHRWREREREREQLTIETIKAGEKNFDNFGDKMRSEIQRASLVSSVSYFLQSLANGTHD